MKLIPLFCLALALSASAATNAPPAERLQFIAPQLAGPASAALRYAPDHGDFVITNGAEFFNRPLYGHHNAFRVDAGDRPEFSFYLPGRGGNLRFGIQTAAGTKWLNNAQQIVTRYRPGGMIYEISDPLLGADTLTIFALPLKGSKGLVIRATMNSNAAAAKLIWAFGGVNGMKGQRGGDIGCEREPVSKIFQLRAEQCRSNEISIATNTFFLRSKTATMAGTASAGAALAVGDAQFWAQPEKLFLASERRPPARLVDDKDSKRAGSETGAPLVIGQMELSPSSPVFLAIRQTGDDGKNFQAEDLPELFSTAEKDQRAIAGRVVVETPDPFINAAAGALNIAADAIWDDAQQSFMHGAVAWRQRLLGWRGPFAGDALGWHERTAAHFTGYARQQNVDEIPEKIPAPEESANLSRNENALHSQGDLMNRSHYDMNLLAVDAFFRHLLWTGDLEFARTNWPVIEKHFAWEKRLFRREFAGASPSPLGGERAGVRGGNVEGHPNENIAAHDPSHPSPSIPLPSEGRGKPDSLPLYEGYAAIWASDDLAYNGGGAAHASALNFFANKTAARVAKLLGKDSTPYEREADLISRAMQKFLWLTNEGNFAEFKDYLGLQLPHPNAALWTFYHTLDSEVPTPDEAGQMADWFDKNLAHIQIGNRKSEIGNYFVMPTTSWLPYQWSLNNVVVAEDAHAALGFWQAGRAKTAYSLFKGTLLDTMFTGLCPGNVGCMTRHDAVRGEAQRDFGDGIGALSRALIEGLFGVKPDALAGELKIAPGFPAEWNFAKIVHPDFTFEFQRDGPQEKFSIETKFKKPMAVRLQIPALRAKVASVTVNGAAVKWNWLTNSPGGARVEILADAAAGLEIVVKWIGDTLALTPALSPGERGKRFQSFGKTNAASGSENSQPKKNSQLLFPLPAGEGQGEGEAFDWHKQFSAAENFETVPITNFFNDKVTQIFRNEYRAPRSPFASLAMPKQGIGSWCHPLDSFEVNDAGLRSLAEKSGGKIMLPNGVPLATPGKINEKNIAFVSQWENYPREISVPLAGTSSRAFLLMAGSTGAMQSRFDNGEVVVTYADNSTARLALHNPTTWWPIEQDYFIDDFAFARPEPLPVRVDLATGKIRVLEMASFKGKGRTVPGGAATVLDLPLDEKKELKSLTVRALANEVVIGLMSVTLQR